MHFFRIILFPFSLIYGAALAFRNLFFLWKILPIERVEAKVISVGNLSMGGTGKTPHVNFFVQELSTHYHVAILLRGYGRKSKGFLEVLPNSTIDKVGDEALSYVRNWCPDVKVFVCEKRSEGAKKIITKYPQINLVLLDDAYQHRYLHRDVNILLTEYNRPYFRDFVVPSGNLREWRIGKKRADIVVVTKCPNDITSQDKQDFTKKLKIKNTVPVFYSTIRYEMCYDLFSLATKKLEKNILLVTGIGNPIPLLSYLKKQANVKLVTFKDHYQYTAEDIQKIHKLFNTFAMTDKMIITTEKDASRIRNASFQNEVKKYPWYCQPLSVTIDKKEKLLKKIENYAN